MTNSLPMVPLGELLVPISRPETVIPEKKYFVLGAHWYAQGLYVKDVKFGSEIQADKVYRVEEGDFVYNRLFAWKGSFAIASRNDQDCYVSNEFPCFRLKQDKIDGHYLWKYFSRSTAWKEALSLSSGGTPTSRNRLKEAKLLEMEIPLPSLEEQQRIVARIEELAARIEEARGLRREGSNQTEALVLASLSRIFDYNTGDRLPNNWSWQLLSDLLINKKEGITTGPFGTLLQKSDIQLEGIPVLGIANVQANRFVPGFIDYINLQKANSLSRYKLEADDIVIARSGTVGRSCVLPCIDPPPIMSTNLLRLRLRQDIFLPKLLSRLFNGSRLVERLKDAECRGSTRAFFTQHILQKLQLPVPPLPEQYRILAYLDHLESIVDSLKQLQSETSAELDALLPSILDKAFKGEL